MAKIQPYFSVSNALEAFTLYSKLFGVEKIEHVPVGKEQANHFGLTEDEDLSKTTMHMSFKIGEDEIFMSDNFSGLVLDKTNVSILYQPNSLEELQSIYSKVEGSNCEITMKLEKQFWGDYFTSFKDPFGISWQMNFTPSKE